MDPIPGYINLQDWEYSKDIVLNLQYGLRALMPPKRDVIAPQNDETGPTRQELEKWSKRIGQENGRYGSYTWKAVDLFQRQQKIRETVGGNIDQKTADALNAKLREVGELDPGPRPDPDPPRTGRGVVSGSVRRSDGLPMRSVRVRADNETDRGPVQLGEDTTDGAGRYTIRYEAIPAAGVVNLHVSAFDDAERLLGSAPLSRNAREFEVINVTVPFEPAGEALHRIEGLVLTQGGMPVANLTLRLYEMEFGGKSTLVSETTTLDGGRYAFAYPFAGRASTFEIRAVKGATIEVGLSKPLEDLGELPRVVVNLVLPDDLQPAAAEYRRLSDALMPCIGTMSALAQAREDATQRDVTVLNRATGWDARLIAMAATSEKLAAEAPTPLSSVAVYGLLRAGLPSNKLLLSRVESGVVEHALTKVRDAGIVQMSDAEIAAFKNSFVGYSNQVRLEVPAPGSTSTYGQLLASSGLSADAQSKFAGVYLSHRGSADSLWEKAQTDAGLSDAEIATLRMQGRLAFLAGNSEAMTRRLLSKQLDDPSRLVKQHFDRADTWKQEAQAAAGNDAEKLAALIPSAYVGDTVDKRLEAYAEDMARKLRLSYPDRVVAKMVSDGGIPVPADHQPTVKLLDAAVEQGFRLGDTQIKAFVEENPAVTQGMSGSEGAAAQTQIRTLQRLYQITPGNDAMVVLMALNMTSAFDVMAYTYPRFADVYGAKFKEIYGRWPTVTETRLVYERSGKVSSITYNLFAIAKSLESSPPIPSVSSSDSVRSDVRDNLIKHFPTMESLFGSMDFCDCEHCRTVLSPAAYLVDLLQFVDIEPGVWGNFLAQWKATHNGSEYGPRYLKPYVALTNRRPDLPHIPLTCENTQTALPYIDLVNEILEYYVAHDALDANAATDTGEATTADLLAEPQNVIREAYDKLRSGKYPLNLPFDLWLETARRFSEHFDTPLSELLETLRTQDDLFASGQPFDRAAIFLESLGFSPAESAILTDPDPLPHWFELYGYASDGDARTPATDPDTGQRIDLNSAKALSRRLGVSYREIVDILRTVFVNPQLPSLVVLEKLSVSVADARFYLDHKNDPAPTTPAESERKAEVDAFKQKMELMAQKYGVTAAEIEARLAAIHYGQVLVLADADAGCNFDLTTLRYADGTAVDAIALLRINLFTRIWHKLGWTIEETDRALRAYVPAAGPYDAAHLGQRPLRTVLIYIAHQHTLEARVSTGKDARLKLPTLWSDIATTGKNSLYARLFLKRSVLKSDAVFDDAYGEYLSPARVAAGAASTRHVAQRANVHGAEAIDPTAFAGEPRIQLSYDALNEVQTLSFQGVLTDAEKPALIALSPSPALPPLLDAVQQAGREYSLVKGHLVALQGALGLAADDVARILNDAGQSFETAPLSLPNVSLLYRYGLLARGMKLSVRELIALRRLAGPGLDPFTPLHGAPLTTLAEDHPFSQTLRFVDLAQEIKTSALKIDDLDYLLAHRYDPAGKYGEDPAVATAFLKSLATGIRATRGEHAMPPDPGALTDDVLRQTLGLVLPVDVVARFTALMNGTAEFAVTRAAAAEDQLRPADFSGEPSLTMLPYDATTNRQALVHRGILFAVRKAALKAKFDPSLTPGQQAVFDALLDAAQTRSQDEAHAFFDTQLLKQPSSARSESGFLDAADFDLLFDPDLPLTAAEPTPQDRQRRRRARLVAAFWPFLQKRLVRQFVVQTMIAQTGADPALVESLVTDDRLLAMPSPLLDAFASAGEGGTSAKFFTTVDGSGAAQDSAPITADVDTALRDAADGAGNPLPAANSARFEGWLEVPAAGAYRFLIHLEKQGAEAELRFAHLADPLFLRGSAPADDAVLGDQPDKYLELEAGVLYRYSLVLRKLNGGAARLTVVGTDLPQGALARLNLIPATVLQSAGRALVLLNKTLQIAAGLELTERELRYLLTHSGDFDGLNLGRLPTESGDAAAAAPDVLFGQYLRLAAYARLKQEMAGGTDGLIDVFEADATSAVGRLDDAVYPRIAALTRRETAVVRAAARALAAAPAFRSEVPLERLWKALQLVERMRVPVGSLVEWARVVRPSATPEQRFQIARDLKEAIKSSLEPDVWHRVAQPIFDKLRKSQRDALVAYIVHRKGWSRIEELYEYFLIDPGMEPVVQTSRIRLAIASLQLFIQRCLLNLEKEVHPSAIVNASQWEWMKRYRVWEANRKIFLFPENWLEPEFRDDKTHLYAELEGALLQGDVSSDLVEDAFLAYLKKLDELARLDVVAMHIEDKADPANRVLHVFGRTYAVPHKYFYRRYLHQRWTPWEPVSTEIEGNHLVPVIWRDRLCLFWVTFMDKPDPLASPASIGGRLVDATLPTVVDALKPLTLKKVVDVHLHWSEYVQGQWSTRESGDLATPVPVKVDASFVPNEAFIHVSKESVGGEDGGVYIHLGAPISKAFYLAGRNSAPEQVGYQSNPAGGGLLPSIPYANTVADRANRYSGSGSLQVRFTQRMDTSDPNPNVETPSLLSQIKAYTLLACDNRLIELGVSEDAYSGAIDPAKVQAAIEHGLDEIEGLIKPVFVQDNAQTFFVEPTVTETTVDKWQEWVTRTPVSDPDPWPWQIYPDWFDKFVKPVFPIEIPDPMPDPIGPVVFPVDSGALFSLSDANDWLVNPLTIFMMDGQPIGPSGNSGFGIFGLGEATAGSKLAVNTASGLGSARELVLTGGKALKDTGLVAAAGGLNVVGGPGLNKAMVENINQFGRALHGSFGGFGNF